MKLDIRSFLAGALVVGLLWAAMAGSYSTGGTVRRGNLLRPSGQQPHPQTPAIRSEADAREWNLLQALSSLPQGYDLEIGPRGEVYVMDCNDGTVRRVLQQNGGWASEVVAPEPRYYWGRPSRLPVQQ